MAGRLAPSSLDEYMGGLVEELGRLVSRLGRRWKADDIHDARVATRRLTAAINLLSPAVSSKVRKPFEKLLRRLRRLLGPLRDLDVMLEHIQELPSPAAGWVAGQLEKEREGERARVRRKLPGAAPLHRTWRGLEKKVRKAAAGLPKLLEASTKGQLQEFSARAHAACARRPRDKAAGDPHALRIAGKRLRYTLELASVAGQALAPDILKSFKRLQDALGLWHDWLVLSQKVLEVAAEADVGYHDRALYGQVLRLAQVAWQRSERHLGRFCRLWRRGVARSA